MATPEYMELDLADIEIDQKFQPRVKLNKDHIEELAISYEMVPCRVPPPVVWLIGKRKLCVSFHRHAALVKLDRRSGTFEIRRGTEQDALLDAAGSDNHHGLKRTYEDKRRALRMILSVHPKWSAGQISELTGMHRETIKNLIKTDEEMSKIDRSVVTDKRGVEMPAKIIAANNKKTKDVQKPEENNQPDGERKKPGKRKKIEPKDQPSFVPNDDSADLHDEEPATIPAKPVGELKPYYKNDGIDDLPGVYRPRFTKASNGQEVVLDALNRPCPAGVGDTFADPELRKLLADADAVGREAERIRDVFMELHSGRKPGHNFAWAHIPTITGHIDKARDHLVSLTDELRDAIPYVVCPKCHGERKGCKDCRTTGYWPRHEYEHKQDEFKNKEAA